MIDALLHKFTAAVAGHLDGFRAAFDDDHHHYVRATWLVHNDGRRLRLLRPYPDTDRVFIDGCFPPGERSFRKSPGITVGLNREPAAVAREIGRRLMPRYTQQLKQLLDDLRQQADTEARRHAAASRLVGMIPDATARTAQSSRDRVRTTSYLVDTALSWRSTIHPGCSGEIMLTDAGDTAALEARSVPIAVVEQVMAALTATRPPSSSAG